MIIFDLDGTLYRIHETCIPPLYDVCKRFNILLTPEDEKFLLYTTVKSLLDRVATDMPQNERDEFEREKWREIEVVKERGRLFDHVEEVLSSFYDNSIEMAICGMGSKEYIETVLDYCHIRHYFKFVSHRMGERTKAEALKQLLQDAY